MASIILRIRGGKGSPVHPEVSIRAEPKLGVLYPIDPHSLHSHSRAAADFFPRLGGTLRRRQTERIRVWLDEGTGALDFALPQGARRGFAHLWQLREFLELT